MSWSKSFIGNGWIPSTEALEGFYLKAVYVCIDSIKLQTTGATPKTQRYIEEYDQIYFSKGELEIKVCSISLK